MYEYFVYDCEKTNRYIPKTENLEWSLIFYHNDEPQSINLSQKNNEGNYLSRPAPIKQ